MTYGFDLGGLQGDIEAINAVLKEYGFKPIQPRMMDTVTPETFQRYIRESIGNIPDLPLFVTYLDVVGDRDGAKRLRAYFDELVKSNKANLGGFLSPSPPKVDEIRCSACGRPATDRQHTVGRTCNKVKSMGVICSGLFVVVPAGVGMVPSDLVKKAEATAGENILRGHKGPVSVDADCLFGKPDGTIGVIPGGVRTNLPPPPRQEPQARLPQMTAQKAEVMRDRLAKGLDAEEPGTIRGKLTHGAGVLIVRKSFFDPVKVLVSRRNANQKWFPNLFQSPGGSLEPGEEPLAGAVRELYEETLLRTSDLDAALKPLDPWQGTKGDETYIMHFFYAPIKPTREAIQHEPDKAGPWQFIPLHVLIGMHRDELIPGMVTVLRNLAVKLNVQVPW